MSWGTCNGAITIADEHPATEALDVAAALGSSLGRSAMQHHVTAVDSSGCAVLTTMPPVGVHDPGTYTMSAISLLPTSVPVLEKFEHKTVSEVKPDATSSFVLQALSLYTRKIP